MGNSTVNPPVGIQPDDLEADFTARGGNVCAGYCYPLCLEQSTLISADTDPVTGVAAVVTLTAGGKNSVFSNIAGGVGAATTDLYSGLFVIAMESFLDERVGRCKVRGIVDAYVKSTAATFTAGVPIIGETGSSPASLLSAAPATANASPRKYLGHALASGTSVAALIKVNFDGWNGFGGGQV
jgi:hypothetical protein